MLQANRRTTFKLLGGAALAATALPLMSHEAAAEDLVVPNTYQNFKRGTIHSMHPERRIFVIVWEDLGRVKLRAADLVSNFAPQSAGQSAGQSTGLRVGQIVDVQWYDYLDFLITKKTPDSEARAKAMLAQGARLEGIPGAQEPIRLWSMSGMVTKVDAPASVVYLINASGGRPEEPAPDSGEVIQLPPAQTAAGKAAVAGLKPGAQAPKPSVTNPAACGLFKTPTLRNITITAPYMHNGCAATHTAGPNLKKPPIQAPQDDTTEPK